MIVWLLQVRQHTEHKRTFMFLEQVILKYGAAANCINIKDIHEVGYKIIASLFLAPTGCLVHTSVPMGSQYCSNRQSAVMSCATRSPAVMTCCLHFLFRLRTVSHLMLQSDAVSQATSLCRV